jgi:hypothetical protein
MRCALSPCQKLKSARVYPPGRGSLQRSRTPWTGATPPPNCRKISVIFLTLDHPQRDQQRRVIIGDRSRNSGPRRAGAHIAHRLGEALVFIRRKIVLARGINGLVPLKGADSCGNNLASADLAIGVEVRRFYPFLQHAAQPKWNAAPPVPSARLGRRPARRWTSKEVSRRSFRYGWFTVALGQGAQAFLTTL